MVVDLGDDHVLLVIDVPACEASGSPVRWEVPDDAAQPSATSTDPFPCRP
ncbi:hypothetical protein [Kineococcus indalonis]|nr:hypothetical protein [Kineococcus indalonis]NAZ84985.1 hypothetical protein [Kineococcus indalonis]